MLPAFVINLDRSAHRLAHMRAEFGRLGMDFQRFAAVDGTHLAPGLKPYFCNGSGQIASPLTPREIGCYASHLSVWRHMVESGLPAAIVCEDDIELSDDLPTVVSALMRAIPSGWDVVRLVDFDFVGYSRALTIASLPASRSLIRYWQLPMGAGAYLISNDGATKLTRPSIRHRGIDADLRRPWRFGLDQYGVHPPPVTQPHILPSIIGTDRGCRDASKDLPRTLRKMRKSVLKGRQHVYNIQKMGLLAWMRLLISSVPARAPAQPAASVATRFDSERAE